MPATREVRRTTCLHRQANDPQVESQRGVPAVSPGLLPVYGSGSQFLREAPIAEKTSLTLPAPPGRINAMFSRERKGGDPMSSGMYMVATDVGGINMMRGNARG